MKAALLVVACLIAVALGASAPTISETFSASVDITIRDHRGDHKGKGVWAIDQPGNMGVEKMDFDEGEFNIFSLQRYDLGFAYGLNLNNASTCKEFKVEGKMPQLWSWLEQAEYEGSHNGVDMWRAKLGYATMTLGVKTGTNTPVFMIRTARDEKSSTYSFTSWNETTPDAALFTVPTKCNSIEEQQSNLLGCVSGSQAVANGKVWVAHHVPYNQGGDYGGYREDCSGFVSMCWESAKPGHTTSTMHEIAHQISKSELRPGDCLLFAAEHVVLFGGWLNSEQSQYQAYEETRPGEGTVTRATPYPYWYSQNDFIPFRYNSIC